MGNKDEPEWVLERLTTTLDRELEAVRKEELEANGESEDMSNEGKTTDPPKGGSGPEMHQT